METTQNNNNKNSYYLVCIIPNCSCCPPNAKSYLFYFYYADDKFSVFKSDAKKFYSIEEAREGAYKSIENLNKKININICKDDIEIEFYENNKLKKIIQL